jgi:hypothetical protein
MNTPYSPAWISPDGERQLTLADLKDITSRFISVIVESDWYSADEHHELIADLQAVVSLCEDATMTKTLGSFWSYSEARGSMEGVILEYEARKQTPVP